MVRESGEDWKTDWVEKLLTQLILRLLPQIHKWAYTVWKHERQTLYLDQGGAAFNRTFEVEWTTNTHISYRARAKAREFEKLQISQMLAVDVIQADQTEWTPQDVFLPKEDIELFFWVNYRKLNVVRIWDAYMIPHLDECTDSLGDETIFKTIGTDSIYQRVEMANEDRNKPPLHLIMDVFV